MSFFFFSSLSICILVIPISLSLYLHLALLISVIRFLHIHYFFLSFAFSRRSFHLSFALYTFLYFSFIQIFHHFHPLCIPFILFFSFLLYSPPHLSPLSLSHPAVISLYIYIPLFTIVSLYLFSPVPSFLSLNFTHYFFALLYLPLYLCLFSLPFPSFFLFSFLLFPLYLIFPHTLYIFPFLCNSFLSFLSFYQQQPQLK
ncbi:unnamed protein product [Acanthosepion pharaonis]|uniref:Uncharacterized protein n=1 Tax=Acanthosepion pharaonis TaxID=158019 RepID=A0A812CNF7_ACAPH|nr:unnamed protein product [Sepia pharaonis]